MTESMISVLSGETDKTRVSCLSPDCPTESTVPVPNGGDKCLEKSLGSPTYFKTETAQQLGVTSHWLEAQLLYQSRRTNAARDVWKVAATIRLYHPVDFGMLFKTEIHGECLQISCHPTIDGKQDTILDGKTSCSGQKFDIVLHGVERKLWPTTRMGADFAHGKQS